MGQNVELRLQVGCGHTGLLGYLGPLPWLFQAAWEASSQPHGLATRVVGSGVLEPPTLAVWRSAHTSQPFLTILELAGQTAAHHKSGKWPGPAPGSRRAHGTQCLHARAPTRQGGDGGRNRYSQQGQSAPELARNSQGAHRQPTKEPTPDCSSEQDREKTQIQGNEGGRKWRGHG